MTDEYRAYLLRLWRVEDDGGRWRARLENVETGEAQGFAAYSGTNDYMSFILIGTALVVAGLSFFERGRV